MRTHTSIHTWTLGVLVAVLASPVSSMAFRRTAAERSTAKTVVEPFAWPGIYDMVGTGFPDGERRAVMHVARTDTGYALVSLQGPPGTLVRFQVSGDSARVVWNLGGAEVMVVDLRGTADSLTGEWTSGDWFGPVRGVRRR